MTEYLVLLPGSEARYAAATEQELQDLRQAHTEFVELLERRGHKMTGGAQLTPSAQGRVARGTAVDAVSLSDGPYAESAEQVGGYYLVETEDVEDLAQVCGRLMQTPFHPSVEIRPLVQI
jgi:hypothetical protein